MRRPSLRVKIAVWVVTFHLVVAAIVLFTLAGNRFLLLAMEGLFAVSITVGIFLVRSFFVPLRMIRTGSELIQEGDFTARFREVGQPEMDDLIRIYNRMIDRLREERLKLQEQHTFIEKVLAASPAGVVTLDFDGRVSLVNPSATKFFLAAASDLVGKRLDDIEGPLAKDLACAEPSRPRVVTLQGRRRLKCTRAEFFDRGFSRTFFVLEELTDELRASEKAAYEKLVRMISHEVNNSVGSVVSLLDSSRNYAGQIRLEDRGDYLTAIGVAISRMEHLGAFMNGFAEVVRLPEPDRRPCALGPLLDDVLVLLRPELTRRRISIVREESPTIPPIHADRNQIEQVLVNVFRNAIEAIGEEGKIRVCVELDRGRPCLSIADDGPGIAPEARANLFTPFFSTKRDGRGLGLTVIQEILTRHRFEFGLDNLPAGGAEFRIRFG